VVPLTGRSNYSDVIPNQALAGRDGQDPMGATPTRALVLTILRHAEDFHWRMQDVGLMSLRLDDQREYRLHVWDPTSSTGEVPIHDHPYHFTSTIVVGELTNTRYRVDTAGREYTRLRYSPEVEARRCSDKVRLIPEVTTIREGGRYGQLAPELHSSWQLPGTVTLIRCTWVEAPWLTVCLSDERAWRSPTGRDATRHEVKTMAGRALEWF